MDSIERGGSAPGTAGAGKNKEHSRRRNHVTFQAERAPSVSSSQPVSMYIQFSAISNAIGYLLGLTARFASFVPCVASATSTANDNINYMRKKMESNGK